MVGMTAITYLCALAIDKRDEERARRLLLITGLVLDLGILFVFKYFAFFLNDVSGLLSRFNVISAMPQLKLLVPLGISFYTLQTLSYLLDVYKGKMRAERHPGYVATFVAFFPTVSAGPIERGAHLIPQLHEEHKFSYEKATHGLKLVVWGLFKKLVIAERLGVLVNAVYGNVRLYKGLPLIIATFFFAIQLYADFSGYTDIVRGCASIMGFDLLTNFNLPYFARSIRDFWQRWHISMTSWFRDYLYIPLGGNKKGKLRTYINILFVFLVSGLWHGANWTFVVWGAVHGFYQVVGRATSAFRATLWKKSGVNYDGRAVSALKVITTFLLVDFAWIFFRSDSLKDAFYVITHIFDLGVKRGAQASVVGISALLIDCTVILLFLIIELSQLREPLIDRLSRQKPVIRWATYVGIVMVVMMFGIPASKQFIYVRF